MTRGRRWSWSTLTAAFLAAWLVPGCAAPHARPSRAQGAQKETRKLRILALNDLHGQLDPETSGGRDGAPGARALVTALRKARASAQGATLVVSAGDLVGVSPPVSALMQDEPTLMVLNELANGACAAVAAGRRTDLAALAGDPRCDVVATVGNHEFDEGWDELVRLWRGGNHSRGPFLEDPWRGARFPLVAANVLDRHTGAPALPPFVVRDLNGVRVGVIGAVTHEVPEIVNPVGLDRLSFREETGAINEAARALVTQGVRTILVLLHDGGDAPAYDGSTREEARAPERIAALVSTLDPEIDAVVTAHEHGFTNAIARNSGGRPVLVTEALFRGRAFAQIDLAIDPRTGDVVERRAEIVRVRNDGGDSASPGDDVVGTARKAVGVQLARVVATSAAPIPIVAGGATGGPRTSPLGELVADAFRSAAGADVALVLPRSVRADLGAGPITREALYAALPFGNEIVAMDLSGAELLAALEGQWVDGGEPQLFAVAGLRYAWTATTTDGKHVLRASVGAVPLDPTRRYSVAVSDYLAGTGKRHHLPEAARRRATGVGDVDALAAFLSSLPQPVTRPPDGRGMRVE